MEQQPFAGQPNAGELPHAAGGLTQSGKSLQPLQMPESLNSGWRLTGVALAWLAGGAVHLQQASLFPVEVCVAALLAGLIGLGAGFGWRRADRVYWAYWAAVLGAALLAWGAAGWRASERWDDVLPAALEDREITVRRGGELAAAHSFRPEVSLRR